MDMCYVYECVGMFDGCVTRTATCSQAYEMMVIESKVWFVFIGDMINYYVYNIVWDDNSIFMKED